LQLSGGLAILLQLDLVLSGGLVCSLVWCSAAAWRRRARRQFIFSLLPPGLDWLRAFILNYDNIGGSKGVVRVGTPESDWLDCWVRVASGPCFARLPLLASHFFSKVQPISQKKVQPIYFDT
jgi:hypothetical protein